MQSTGSQSGSPQPVVADAVAADADGAAAERARIVDEGGGVVEELDADDLPGERDEAQAERQRADVEAHLRRVLQLAPVEAGDDVDAHVGALVVAEQPAHGHGRGGQHQRELGVEACALMDASSDEAGVAALHHRVEFVGLAVDVGDDEQRRALRCGRR